MMMVMIIEVGRTRVQLNLLKNRLFVSAYPVTTAVTVVEIIVQLAATFPTVITTDIQLSLFLEPSG